MRTGSMAAARAGLVWLICAAAAGVRAEDLPQPSGGWSDAIGPVSGATFPASATVLVRVNGRLVTGEQLDQAMAGHEEDLADAERAGKKRERMSREAMLELIIDKILEGQKAHELGLDKQADGSPGTDAESFVRTLRRYRERLLGGVPAPAQADIEAYFDSHPALFSQRRIYDFREIVAEVPQREREQTKARIARAKTVNELQALLVKRGQLGQVAKATRAAEQLPLAQLDNFHKMKAGQVTISPDPKGLRILILEKVESRPVTLEYAAPAIEAFIHNQRRQAALEADRLALRQAAVIEYVGAKPPAEAKQP